MQYPCDALNRVDKTESLKLHHSTNWWQAEKQENMHTMKSIRILFVIFPGDPSFYRCWELLLTRL